MRRDRPPIPTCTRCKRVSVLDPCRRCASPEQLAKYPALPKEQHVH